MIHINIIIIISSSSSMMMMMMISMLIIIIISVSVRECFCYPPPLGDWVIYHSIVRRVRMYRIDRPKYLCLSHILYMHHSTGDRVGSLIIIIIITITIIIIIIIVIIIIVIIVILTITPVTRGGEGGVCICSLWILLWRISGG